MAWHTSLCVIIAIACTASAADQVKTDQQAMQGRWMVVSFTFNGEPRPEDYYKDLRLEIKGDKYLISQGSETASRTFKLDPAKMPKAMDITYDDGPNNSKTNHAIYVLEGDRLTICRHQQPDMERPKEFMSNAGTNRVLIKWKRIK